MEKSKKAIFPPLREEDIKVVVREITDEGANLMMYVSGDICSIMLDNAFGPFGWQKENNVVYGGMGGNEHKFICAVSVLNGDTWIKKDGLGVVTEFEPDKGEETIAFKRACYNWGVARELRHHAPKILFPLEGINVTPTGSSSARNLYRTDDEFIVEQVIYADEDTMDRRIVKLSILNKTTNKRFIWDIAEELEKRRTLLSKAKEARKKSSTSKPTSSKKTAPVKMKKPEKSSETSSAEPKTDVETDFTVEIGAFKEKPTLLSALNPLQVVWVYENKETTDKQKEICKAYANTNPEVLKLFQEKGII